MLLSIRVPILFLALICVSYANAQDICASYVEQTVQPVQANALWKQLANVPTIKGEYETTAAFEARVKNAIATITNPIIVEFPILRQYIKYDADASRLDIQSNALGYGSIDYSRVFGYGTPFYDKVEYGLAFNINVVFPAIEKQLGSYTGINAMGVAVTVFKVKRFTKAIFERKGDSSEKLFPGLNYGSDVVISFDHVMPAIAKHMKDTIRAAIVYTPKAPYFAKGKHLDSPTIDMPIETDETLEVAIGNIQCALFLNSEGKVLGAVATK